MSSFPSLRTNRRKSSNSVGVRDTGSPRSVTKRRSRSTTSSPSSTTGAVGASSSERGSETGEQLVDPEWLRHVVVGARVQGSDLLLLVADRREDEHRRIRPAAQLAANIHSASVREHEIEDDAVRRAHCGAGQGLLCGGRDVDLVAGSLEARPKRPQDLRFVVDHEDARTAHLASAVRSAIAGSSSTKVDPALPGDPGSTQTRPPFASANPRAIARPRPLPRPTPDPRSNASKIRSRSVSATPGPRSRTRTMARPEAAAARHFDRIGRGELQGVLDQIDEHTLDLCCVDAKRRQFGGSVTSNTIGVRAELSSVRANSVSIVHSSGLRKAGPASRRERSRRFRRDARGGSTSIRIVSKSSLRSDRAKFEGRVLEPFARSPDRSER